MNVPFAAATARDVRLYRALIFGLLAFDIAMRPLGALAGFPPELLHPVGVLRLLPAPWLAALFADPGWLTGAGVAGCLLAASGLGFRFVALPVCLLVTVQASVVRSYHFPYHADVPVLLTAWAFAVLVWADQRERGAQTPETVRAMRTAPLVASFGILLLAYHMMGLTRLVEGGLEIYTNGSLRWWAVSNAQVANWRQALVGGVGQDLAQIDGLMAVMNAGFPLVTALEILAPAALLWRRFRLVFLAVILPFHVLSLFLLGVFFYQTTLMLLVLPWLDRRPRAGPGPGDAAGPE